MNVFREFAYGAKKLLLNLYGPARLDDKHDPVVQLDREHDAELREERAQERSASDQSDRASG